MTVRMWPVMPESRDTPIYAEGQKVTLSGVHGYATSPAPLSWLPHDDRVLRLTLVPVLIRWHGGEEFRWVSPWELDNHDRRTPLERKP